MYISKLRIFSIFFILYLLGCSSENENVIPNSLNELDRNAIYQYLHNSGIDTSLIEKDTNGIYFYPIVSQVSGKSFIDGNVFSIFYTLKTTEGKDISSKTFENDGFPVKIGVGIHSIFPYGLDLALMTSKIKENEKFGFIIPPSLGLVGINHLDVINAQTILHFEVEVKEIINLDEQKTLEIKEIENYVEISKLNDLTKHPVSAVVPLTEGIYLKKLQNGNENVPFPKPNDTLRLDYVIRYIDSTKVDEYAKNNPYEFIFQKEPLFSGFQIGISNMRLNEKSLLLIPSHLGYGASAYTFPEFLGQKAFESKIIPKYALKVKPYKVLLVETQLNKIN